MRLHTSLAPRLFPFEMVPESNRNMVDRLFVHRIENTGPLIHFFCSSSPVSSAERNHALPETTMRRACAQKPDKGQDGFVVCIFCIGY
jgi:hypothetical protein